MAFAPDIPNIVQHAIGGFVHKTQQMGSKSGFDAPLGGDVAVRCVFTVQDQLAAATCEPSTCDLYVIAHFELARL